MVAVVTSAAPELEAAARATAEQGGKAVVTVRLVLKLKSGGQEHEQKMEAPGVVIDPTGLTVASASSIDPSGAFRRMVDAQRQRVNIESEVKEPVILLEDGTELEAAVVLKDTDLDTGLHPAARSRAEAPGGDAEAALGHGATPDAIYVLGRLSKLANRALSVATGEVRTYVRGPSPYYVTDGESSSFVGSLAYTADGVRWACSSSASPPASTPRAGAGRTR